MKNINIQNIRIDGGTQSRVKVDEPTIADYAQVLRDGGELPPVVVFFDGAEYWLADGFHRLHAYRADDRASIPADVRTGTQRDAILYSFGANGAHGLRRTNEDKRKAVSAMLADAEWSALSDREIARYCAVTHPFVAATRRPQVVTVTTPEAGQVVTVTTPSAESGADSSGKPASKPEKQKPTTTPEPANDDELNEARHTIGALAEEVEDLKAKLAVEQMDASEEAKTEAAQIIESLRVENKSLTAELNAMRLSRDQLQQQVHELMRQLKLNQRELNKARAA